MKQSDDRLVWDVVDDEALILDLSTGYYFSLNPVATEIWMQLQAGDDVHVIVDRLVRKFGIDTAIAAQDVRELTDDLRAAKLLAE